MLAFRNYFHFLPQGYRILVIKEQLDQLENSVLQVLSAYSDAKKEIETLKAELAQKNEEIAQLQAADAAVRDRLGRIAADLVAELPQA